MLHTLTSMRLLPLRSFQILPFGLHLVAAANSFAGSNLYYAAGLRADTRTTLLELVECLCINDEHR